MSDRFELYFKCCENTVPLGSTRVVGQHGDHCLACDTANPATEVRKQ